MMVESIQSPHGVKLRKNNNTTHVVTNADDTNEQEQSITQTQPLDGDFEYRKSSFATCGAIKTQRLPVTRKS